MLRAQAHDLPDAHRPLEQQIVDEGRHAGAARVPLRADDAAEVDPGHDLPAEDRPERLACWGSTYSSISVAEADRASR